MEWVEFSGLDKFNEDPFPETAVPKSFLNSQQKATLTGGFFHVLNGRSRRVIGKETRQLMLFIDFDCLTRILDFSFSGEALENVF